MPLTLSAGQLVALQNLAHKKDGDKVDWINISDARALTELGLAVRSREGWQITADGISALEAVANENPPINVASDPDHQVVQMRKSYNEED